jgi:hypothetical protein
MSDEPQFTEADIDAAVAKYLETRTPAAPNTTPGVAPVNIEALVEKSVAARLAAQARPAAPTYSPAPATALSSYENQSVARCDEQTHERRLAEAGYDFSRPYSQSNMAILDRVVRKPLEFELRSKRIVSSK